MATAVDYKHGTEVNEVTDAEVFIFTKNECGYCDRTKAFLDRKGIKFHYLNVSLEGNEHFYDQLVEEGVASMPAVRTKLAGDWTGMRPDKISELGLAHAAEQKALATAA